MKALLISIGLLTASLLGAQEKVQTFHRADAVHYVDNENLVLLGDSLSVLNRERKVIFSQLLPNGALVLESNYVPADNSIYIKLQYEINGNYRTVNSVLNLVNLSYSPIDNNSFKQPEKDHKFSPDRSFYYLINSSTSKIFNNNDEQILALTLESPIKFLDLNPYTDNIALAGSKFEIRLINTSNMKSFPLSVMQVKKAFFVDENAIMLLTRDVLKTYNPQNPSEEHFKIENVENFMLSPDRTEIAILYEDKAELWKMEPVKGNVLSTSSVSEGAQAVLSQLSDEDAQIYLLNKDKIDYEIDLKSELFNPKGEFEKSSEYESRINKGKAHINEIFNYYKNKQRAYDNLTVRLDELRLNYESERDALKKFVEDSLSVAEQERSRKLAADKIRKSYHEYIATITSINSYNADRELYEVLVEEKHIKINMPPDTARLFKDAYENFTLIGAKQLYGDPLAMASLGYQLITPNGTVYKSIGAREPRLVPPDQVNRLLVQTIEDLKASKSRSIEEINLTKVDQFVYDKIKTSTFHAFIIGVEDYASETIEDLSYPIEDGMKLKRVLTDKYAFKDENVTFLKNPTRVEIIEKFDELALTIKPEDNLLIFYAGHGEFNQTLKQGYWLPSDAKANSKAAWISNSTIRDYITGIQSQHTLLVADACFSGGIFKTRDGIKDQGLAYANLYKLQSRKAITSGYLTAVQDQSTFMYYLLKRLTENTSPMLTAEELFASLKIPVANNNVTGQVPQFGDILNTGDEGGDFIFVIDN